MSDDEKRLVVPRDGFVRFKFSSEAFRSRLIHWTKVLDPKYQEKWVEEECRGRDCFRCLEGDRVQQRFAAIVDHENEPKVLELPLSAWKTIGRQRERLGPRFFSVEFELAKTWTPIGMEYDLSVIS